MDDELYQLKMRSMYLCDRLQSDIARFKDDSHSFFGGEIYRTYLKANDQALEKVRYIQNKLRNTQ